MLHDAGGLGGGRAKGLETETAQRHSAEAAAGSWRAQHASRQEPSCRGKWAHAKETQVNRVGLSFVM